jgi:hypothetical protein
MAEKTWKARTGQKIEALYAWVAIEPDGGEGVCAGKIGGAWAPFIGADLARVESYRDLAMAVSKATGLRVMLVRYDGRFVLEELRDG